MMLQNHLIVMGIELGSTRIKTVMIGNDYAPIAEGAHTWENQFLDGVWTYSLEAVWKGIQDSYAECVQNIKDVYGVEVKHIAGIGISAMMHGYLAFDEKDELLVPFRTWRNTITKEAAAALTELFHYNIPQRWSIAHLYQAVLNKEEHVPEVCSIMTLAEYVHWKLTGKKVIGVGDASGMFPIDISTGTYNKKMIAKFDALPEVRVLPWDLEDILPETLMAGEDAGNLTAEGAALLDPSGNLQAGALFCPPEGDAQTGMMAYKFVRVRTGNVSAGTSDFAILVLEKELSDVYTEIDLVTSPTGKLVANVHCNNCTSDLNAWVGLFAEFTANLGMKADMNQLYSMLYNKALEGEKDCGGLLAYNYFSGEGITGLDAGKPIFLREPDSKLTLANFMRTHLYASLATLKIGMDIITEKEHMSFDRIMAHGGLFKTEGVGQKILASALNTPITVMETASQGGAWGIALLARYMITGNGKQLEDWLEQDVFAGEEGKTMEPDSEDVEGFKRYLTRYVDGLEIERAAATCIR